MKTIILFILVFTVSCESFSQSNQGNQEKSKVNVWGIFFGDYFYKSGGDSTGNSLQYTQYVKEFNAFALRRTNIGFDYSLNEDFDTRFSLSYDGPDTLSDGNFAIYVRDAFITWKEIFKNSNLTLGVQPTPGYDFISQKWWGYRSIEQTIMGQRGILGSRDLGIMLSGVFDNAKDFGYFAMVGNGNGNKFENNKYKKIYGTLFGSFVDKKIVANIYSDYQSFGNDQSKTTIAAFAGYRNNNVSLGAESFFQIQNNFNTTDSTISSDVVPFGVSVYFNQWIIESELKYFVRYDFYNGNINNPSTGFYQSFMTAGLDFMPAGNVHFMPNIWLNSYTAKTNQIKKFTSQVVPRLTFWYDFK